MSQEHLWVIAYDTPSDKRRRKLAKVLEGYGARLQRSVFECHLQTHQVQRLRQILSRIATPRDSIRLWSVPPRFATTEQLGRPVELPPWEDKVI